MHILSPVTSSRSDDDLYAPYPSSNPKDALIKCVPKGCPIGYVLQRLPVTLNLPVSTSILHPS
jgi:hypothetical protein